MAFFVVLQWEAGKAYGGTGTYPSWTFDVVEGQPTGEHHEVLGPFDSREEAFTEADYFLDESDQYNVEQWAKNARKYCGWEG